MPTDLEHNQIYYSANKMYPEVRVSEAACKLLVEIPKAFMGMALKDIVKEAKEQGVTMVDEEFTKAFNERWKAKQEICCQTAKLLADLSHRK